MVCGFKELKSYFSRGKMINKYIYKHSMDVLYDLPEENKVRELRKILNDVIWSFDGYTVMNLQVDRSVYSAIGDELLGMQRVEVTPFRPDADIKTEIRDTDRIVFSGITLSINTKTPPSQVMCVLEKRGSHER